MQANDSPNLPCTTLLLSAVTQPSLLDMLQAYFDAAVAWLFLSLEGEQSFGRERLVFGSG